MVYFDEHQKKAIGRRLKDLRKKMGLTQIQLAKKIECSGHTIINYERGVFSEKTGCPDMYIILRLADLFCVSVDYLLCRPDAASATGLSPEALQVLTNDYKDVQERLKRRVHIPDTGYLSFTGYNAPEDFQSLAAVVNFLLADGRADIGSGGLLDLLRAYFTTPDDATIEGLPDGISSAGRRGFHLDSGQVAAGMYYAQIQQTLVQYRNQCQKRQKKKKAP